MVLSSLVDGVEVGATQICCSCLNCSDTVQFLIVLICLALALPPSLHPSIPPFLSSLGEAIAHVARDVHRGRLLLRILPTVVWFFISVLLMVCVLHVESNSSSSGSWL